MKQSDVAYKKPQAKPSKKSKKSQALTFTAMVEEVAYIHNSNGGCTYNIMTGKEPRKGFAVAIFGTTSRIFGSKLTGSHIADYLKTNLYKIVSNNYCIGTWYDKETQYTYIETVQVVLNKKDALIAGQYNAQRFVYDLGKGECIEV